MSEKFYTILTNIGKSKIANFAINGEEVKFVKLKVGDGNGKYYNPIENQKDLINTVWEGKIGNIQIDKDNPNWIVIESIIPPEVGDFTIREYGAFDEEDNLLAISKCPETYKPTISNGSTKELIIKMILSVSNTESISFEVDPNIMLAKKSKVDEIDKKVNHTISQLKDLMNSLSQLSNPNLIINGGFRNPINQRRQTLYSTVGYSIDRWRLSNSAVEFKINNGFMTLTTLTETSGVECEQYIEYPKELSGKSVTISFKYKTTSKYFKMFVHSFESGNIGNIENDKLVKDGKWHEVSTTIKVPILTTDNKFKIGFQFLGEPSFPKGEVVDIEWVKLELGSVATPFVPRPYSEELALCWRYFRKLNMDGIAVLTDPSTVVLHLGGNVPMRVNPSVSFSTTAYLHTNGETSAINITNATFNGDSGQTLYAGISGVPGGKYGTINASSAANDFVSGAVWLYLDSEIY